MLRVQRLIERGRAAGLFRTDQPVEWLTACYFAIVHGAASEIRAGRLSETQAAAFLPSTILALVSEPTERLPRAN